MISSDKFSQSLYSVPLPIQAPRRELSNLYTTRRGREGLILTLEEIRKESATCWFCQLANFSIHAQYPITITNDQDDATFPQGFQFIEKSELCEGVEAAQEDFRTGCDCKNDADCERMVCNCLQDMNIRTENPKAKVYAYLSRGQNKGCLRDAILDSRDPIYECHEDCKCSSECNNRVVGKGRQVPLEIFRTKDGRRGWGTSENSVILFIIQLTDFFKVYDLRCSLKKGNMWISTLVKS